MSDDDQSKPNNRIGAIWAKRTKESQLLIRRMLDPNPSKRISAAKALDHDWFTLKLPTLNIMLLEQAIDGFLKFKPAAFNKRELQTLSLTYLVHKFASPEHERFL